MGKSVISIFFLITTLVLIQCEQDKPETGKVTFNFEELVDYMPLERDTLQYINEAGNEYMITEVQYFISNLKIYYQNGNSYLVTQDNGIHYIDSDIPETHSWEISDNVPAGVIDSIVFTFGLDEEANQSGIFTDPPESNMFWPEQLGGGYHYMKLNGKWLDAENNLKPFNFHLGIGQNYDTTGQVTGFVQNYFRVSIGQPVYSSFILNVNPGQLTSFSLHMNVDSWFKTPHTWDFNEWGGMMMQNQAALKAACENGYDVFMIGPDDE